LDCWTLYSYVSPLSMRHGGFTVQIQFTQNCEWQRRYNHYSSSGVDLELWTPPELSRHDPERHNLN
jgi:hypothetical protein